jgi:hypothetical protein
VHVPDSAPLLAERAAKIKELEKQARDYDRQGLEYKCLEARTWLEHTKSEFEQLADECAHQLWRRGELNRELKAASDGPATIRAWNPGEKPSRPKLEVLTDLSQCVSWLALFLNDPDLASEASEISNQLTEAWQQQ